MNKGTRKCKKCNTWVSPIWVRTKRVEEGRRTIIMLLEKPYTVKRKKCFNCGEKL